MVTIPISKTQHLLDCLAGLEGHLRLEYARGRIWYERDVQRATIGFLIDRLSTADERWLFGAEHRLGEWFPDVVCYYLPTDFGSFVRQADKSVVGVIEIKWRAKLGDDLNKLSLIQQRYPCAAWMIYGDHFRTDIHQGYARQQDKRAEDIEQWQGQAPSRGRTILKCGRIEASGLLAPYGEILSALNSSGDFWITDSLDGRPSRPRKRRAAR